MDILALSEPVELTMPMNFTYGIECTYWDEHSETWLPTSMLVCATSHLTLFAGIVRSFLSIFQCSNAYRLTKAAYEEVLRPRGTSMSAPSCSGCFPS